MKRFSHTLALAILIGGATPLAAQTTDHNAHHSAEIKIAQADGEVRKIDMDAKKITIRHGAIENLGMPPMTMVFQVKDPALLDKVKAGDKVKFLAEKIGGAFTVTQIEPAK